MTLAAGTRLGAYEIVAPVKTQAHFLLGLWVAVRAVTCRQVFESSGLAAVTSNSVAMQSSELPR
jgi:hypothetical protein